MMGRGRNVVLAIAVMGLLLLTAEVRTVEGTKCDTDIFRLSYSCLGMRFFEDACCSELKAMSDECKCLFTQVWSKEYLKQIGDICHRSVPDCDGDGGNDLEML